MRIEAFSMGDYEEAAALWAAMPEIGLDDADARENMDRFLARNPGMSFVARHEGKVVGAVLCGHDGRRGYLHHLAVLPQHRNRGLGRDLVDRCLRALAAAGIQRCNIFIYAENEDGKRFWRKTGWSTYEGLELMFRSTESRTASEGE